MIEPDEDEIHWLARQARLVQAFKLAVFGVKYKAQHRAEVREYARHWCKTHRAQRNATERRSRLRHLDKARAKDRERYWRNKNRMNPNQGGAHEPK